MVIMWQNSIRITNITKDDYRTVREFDGQFQKIRVFSVSFDMKEWLLCVEPRQILSGEKK
jgi:hypothetical protein